MPRSSGNGTRPPFIALLALTAVAIAFGITACGGTTGGEQGPVDVTGNQPVAGGGLHLGSGSSAGVTITDASLHASGSGVVVVASVSADHPDQLVSIVSNYTARAILPKPLPVSPGRPTAIDSTTAVLQPVGPIDDGATVAVSFDFRHAGMVAVYATYHA